MDQIIRQYGLAVLYGAEGILFGGFFLYAVQMFSAF